MIKENKTTMTLTSLLVNNFMETFVNSPNVPNAMIGGKRMDMRKPRSTGEFFTLLLIFLIIILIKAYIVYLGYNYVMPRILYSLNQERSSTLQEVESKFRPISFTESIILTIFMNTLLG